MPNRVNKLHRRLWCLATLTLLSGCPIFCAFPSLGVAATTAPTTMAAAARPTTIAGVENFARVSPGLYRGAQPTAEGFATLKKMGIKTVLDLRTFHSDRSLLKGTGLQYAQIRAKAWHPEDEDVLEFLKIALDPKNQPVFVHCAQGADRTGYMLAVYRMLHDGWTEEQAVAELKDFGFHPIWFEIRTYLNHLDVPSLPARLEKIQPPKIEVIP